MSESLGAPEHVWTLAVIAAGTVAATIAARSRPGVWIRVLAAVLVLDEASWWVYLLLGGVPGIRLAQSLPLQLCDVGIFVAALALWTRNQALAEITYFWALAGAIQALLTPDLPQHFPSYPFFQYYLAHGGAVAAALILVVGLRLEPRPWAVVRVAALTAVYAACVGMVDAATGADYMYLRAKPPSPTLLDVLGPWPVYVFSAAAVAAALFLILDAPFRVSRAARLRQRRPEPPG